MRRRSWFPVLMLFLAGVSLLGIAQETFKPAVEASQVEVWKKMMDRGYDLHLHQSDYVTAEKIFRESLDYAQQHNLGTECVAESYEGIGSALRAQRRYAEAEIAHRTALQMGRSVLPEDSDEIREMKVGLGIALIGLGQYDEAERLVLEALDAYEKQPQVSACDLVFPLDALAMLYKSSRQYQKGERVYTEAFALLTTKRGVACDGFTAMLDHLAELYADDGQWDHVEKIQRGRIDLALGMEGPRSAHYADGLFALGETLLKRHRWEEAATAFGQAADVYRKTDPPSSTKLGYSLERQEMSLYSAGKPEEAKRVHLALLALDRSSETDPTHGELMSLHSRVVEAQQKGDLDAAGQLVARELAVSQKLPAPDQMIALTDSAAIYEAQQRISEAEEAQKRVLALSIATTGPASRATADAHYQLGWFYSRHHRLSEAEQSYATAVSLYGPHDGDRVKLTLTLLGRAYLSEQKFDQAVPIFERAVTLAQETHDDLQLSIAWANLADIYHKSNRLPEAEAAYNRAINIAQGLPKPMNRAWISMALGAATFYQQTGRPAQAEQLYRHIITVAEQEVGANNPAMRLPLDGLISVLRSQGRSAEAAKYEARRDQLPAMPKLPGGGD